MILIVISLVLVFSISFLIRDLNALQQTNTNQAAKTPATDSNASGRKNKLMIRIAEIKIHPNNLEEYKAILKEEAEASIRLEPGVVSIFPMYQKKTLLR